MKSEVKLQHQTLTETLQICSKCIFHANGFHCSCYSVLGKMDIHSLIIEHTFIGCELYNTTPCSISDCDWFLGFWSLKNRLQIYLLVVCMVSKSLHYRRQRNLSSVMQSSLISLRATWHNSCNCFTTAISTPDFS